MGDVCVGKKEDGRGKKWSQKQRLSLRSDKNLSNVNLFVFVLENLYEGAL